MIKLLSAVLSGAVSGAIYAIMASGLVLTYSTTGIFNLSYGAIAFACAYVYFQLNTGLGLAIVPSAVIVIAVFAPTFGFVLNRVVFRSLSRTSVTTRILATVGLLVALPALCQWVVQRLVAFFPGIGLSTNADPQGVPGIGPSPAHVWTLTSGLTFDSNEMIVFVAAALSAVTLWGLVRHTRLGLGMRATVDRPNLAAVRGVDPNRTTMVASVVGTTLAAIAGVVGAPILHDLNGFTFTLLMFISATAAVLGRLRSIPLAFVGGLALGVIQELVARYVTFTQNISGLQTSVPFLLLFVGLFFLARNRSRIGSLAGEDPPPPDHTAMLPPWRRRLPWAVSVVVLIVYTLFLAGPFWAGLVASGLALGLVFLSFVVITGLGGMVSLAQAAFVTTGALAAGWMVAHGVPFVGAAAVGTIIAMVVGLVVAVPALRLGGLPLALATLALAFLGDELLFQLNVFTNDRNGWTINRPSIFGFTFASQRSLAMLFLVFIGVVIVLIHGLQRSAVGRAIVAVRSSEAGAVTSGISPARAKLIVFGISAAIAGFGGVMLGTYTTLVNPSDYGVVVGITWLAVTVLFGLRRPGAAVIAGLVTALAPQIMSYVTKSQLVPTILFGLGAIGLARNPEGSLYQVSQLFHRRRSAAAPLVPAFAADGDEPLLGVGGGPSAAGPDASSIVVATNGASAAPGSGPASLVVEGLWAGYGELEVLQGVDLTVAHGRILALLGSNGAGKSTLCSVIAGLLPATRGTVRLDGADITQLRPSSRANQGLVLCPEGRGVFPALTVEENLRLWTRSVAEVEAAYVRFPILRERRDRPAGILSGGEQQILSLAPLLVRPPRVLVADEPTLGLAPQAIALILQLLRELGEQGVTVLLAEEKAQHVLDLADEVVFMELGRVSWSGPAGEIDGDRLARGYLGG